jgi:hypothetical protein
MYTIDTKTYYPYFGHGGRFGNYFFRNLLGSILAKKYDLKAIYKYQEIFDKLNIKLYSGNNYYNNSPIIIDDNNYLDFINGTININNKLLLFGFYQKPDFCKFLKNYFHENHRDYFNNNNKYYNRSNNNLFIHIRLDDAEKYNPGFNYYDKVISSINYDIGYISTDTPNHKIVIDLINKYNLELYDSPIEETLLFSSTCKNIVLSNGTFSWLIGFLSNKSNIYYPSIKKEWHGNIFIFDEWKCITIE